MCIIELTKTYEFEMLSKNISDVNFSYPNQLNLDLCWIFEDNR